MLPLTTSLMVLAEAAKAERDARPCACRKLRMLAASGLRGPVSRDGTQDAVTVTVPK
ncbi:hypothetical protein V6L77_18615 [Pannonibacter sp. Pt2-lr]